MKSQVMLLHIILFGVLCFKAVSSQEPIVELNQGSLRGVTLTNRDGGKFYGFKNIPYAAPPLGELRFKPPRPAAGWEGIRDASAEVPSCTQFSLGFHPSTFGEEDCLYLNVYTPEFRNGTQKAVLVYIHGGGFMWGSAASWLIGPEFLLTKDVVLVTINYRLGIFGALSVDDPNLGYPGNIGMRDQSMALLWIQNNIERFGGDRDNVLIFGESAGSISCHLHMLSPYSAGLFSKVIGQSGSAVLSAIGARNTAILVAEQLGLQTENVSLTIETLKQLPANVVSEAAQVITESGLDYIWFTNPIIEKPSTEYPFLDKDPFDIIASGNYSHLPYLTGFNNLEGLLWEQLALGMTGQSMLIEDFTEFIPPDLQIASGSEEEKILADRIREFYFGDTEPNRDDIMPAVNLWGDLVFSMPAYRSVAEHVKTSTEPVFLYYLSLDTQMNFMKTLNPNFWQFPGAAHGDEHGYLFQTIVGPPYIAEGSPEDIGIKTMVELWTNFAIYGNPTPANSTFKWEAVRADQVNFLQIGTDATYPDVNPRAKNMEFWSRVYEEFFPRR